MAFYIRPRVDHLIAKVRGLLEKLEFSSIDLESRFRNVGRRDGDEIRESNHAHEQHGRQNNPEAAAAEVDDRPELDPAGNELRFASVARGLSGNLILILKTFINAQRTLLWQPSVP